MKINYPAGTAPKNLAKRPKKRSKPILKVAPGNRGMAFEDDINKTNDFYREKGLCLITKRPTPINIVKVDYTKGAKITQAYFETQSTTDYNGVYKGRYIDFEAKSCRSKTSFPLSNIPKQQITHLKLVLEHGGIAFFLINFLLLGETYLLPASEVISFYEERPRASIPLGAIREKGTLIAEGYNPRFDYLPALEDFFFKQQ